MAMELGFAAAGVAPALGPHRPDALRDWLAAGKHGSMTWLESDLDKRLDPERELLGAKSVIMVADRYATRADGGEERVPDGHGRIARYARGRDYHPVIKKRLHRLVDGLRAVFPAEQFRAFVDTAPVCEREHALRAGLGWIGKHTLIISPTLGSYLLLGGALTTLRLEPDPEKGPEPDHCGTCTRCIDACPTGAIAPYSVDATRCISYLTIEHRGEIAREFHTRIGDRLFGCDVCQEVCPHNAPRALMQAPAREKVNPELAPRIRSLSLLEVVGWRASDRRHAFTTSAMKRAGLDTIRRNAIIAAGNTSTGRARGRLLALLRLIAVDAAEPALLRRTAEQVLGRPGPSEPKSEPPAA